MSKFVLAAALAAMIASPAFAQPPAAPAAAAPAAPAGKPTTATPIKALLANDKSKAVLVTRIPQIAEFFTSGQAEGVLPPETTLVDLAEIPQAQEAGLNADALKAIGEDLAKL